MGCFVYLEGIMERKRQLTLARRTGSWHVMAAGVLIGLVAVATPAAAAPSLRPAAVTASASVPGTTSAAGSSSAVRRADATATGALTTVDTEVVHGGYTAAGIGMRNLGRGTISITGIPSGATVKSATLLWDVLANTAEPSFAAGTFRSVPITGTQWASGVSPCWPVSANFSYEADVTTLVGGNGSYALGDFPSGDTSGSDPWDVGSDPPLLEGATLVVIYQKASMPQVVVQIAEGATETQAGGAVSATLSGFSVTSAAPAKTTYIVADGQEPDNTAAFDGTTLPGVGFPGGDPQAGPAYSMGDLWDTQTADVSSLVKPGDTSESATVAAGGDDCIVWVGQVLQVPGTGFIPIPSDSWRSYTTGDSPLPGWDPINMVIVREGYAADVAALTPDAVAAALRDKGAPWNPSGIGSGVLAAFKGNCVSEQDAAVQPGDTTRSAQDFSWRRVGSGCLSWKLVTRGATTNHVRGYVQQDTGAWFLAVSQEQFCFVGKFGITPWHCITPDGYNEGRLQLVDDLKRLPGYEVDVTYVHEYPPGSPPFASKDPLGRPSFDDLVAVVTIQKKPKI
jgi:hypothetical protein